MINKCKPLAVWNTTAEEDTITPEEQLIEAIVKQATNDYIQCIKQGAMYLDRNIRYNTIIEPDSCLSIIRNIEKNDILNIYYNIEWEYVFKRLDKEYGYWFTYYCGERWVHPWDMFHHNTNANNIKR